MATNNKSINIQLKLDGEKEARDAISNINRELKTVNAELKRNEARYGAAGDSAKGLAEKYNILSRQLDLQKQKWRETSNALDEAKKKSNDAAARVEEAAKKLEKAQEALASTKLEEGSKKYEKLEKAVKKASEELTASQKAAQNATSNVQKWNTSLIEADTAQTKTAQSMKEIRDRFDEAGISIADAASGAAEFKTSVWDAIDTASAALASAGLVKGFQEMKDAIVECAEESIKWESAFAGVRKTVEGSAEEMEKLEGQLLDLSTEIPLKAEELAGIGEIAGQLGIHIENIAEFTKVAAEMATATNLSAEEAATAMSRIANITKTPIEDIGRMGAAVVDLGNNFATTESEITNLTIRLAAAGTQAGMSLPDIMGFAAALASVGMETQAGGSAISKMIKTVQIAVETNSGALASYAEVAGMTAEAFAELWSEDAAAGMQRLIEGIANVDENSASIIKTLDDLGVTELRTSDAMARLASNHELLADAVKTANDAWDENRALVDEANTRYSTTESRLIMAQNAVDGVKRALGEQLNPAINNGIELFGNLAGAAENFVRNHEGTAAVITAIATSLGTMATAGAAAMVIAKLGPALIAAFTGPAGIIMGIVSALAGLTAGIVAYSAAQQEAVEHTHESEKAYNAFADSVKKAEESQKAYEEASQKNTNLIREQVDELMLLAKQEDASAATKAEIKKRVEELNGELDGLNLQYDELTGTLSMNAEEIMAWAEKTYKAQEAAAALQVVLDRTRVKADARTALDGIEAKIEEKTAAMNALKAKMEALGGEDKVKRDYRSGLIGNKERDEFYAAKKEVESYRQELAGLYEEQTKATFAILDANKEIEEHRKQYELLSESAEGAEQGLSSVADATTKTGKAAALSAEEVKALQKQITALEKDKDKVTASIKDVGDAVQEAFKNKAQEAYDATVDGIKSMQDAEEAASKKRLEVWEDEYKQKVELIEKSAEKATASIKAQIEELDALTAAQSERLEKLNAEQKLEKDIEGRASTAVSKTELADKARAELEGLSGQYAAILKEYDAAAEATRDGFAESIAALGDEYAAVLDDYQRRIEQANAVASAGIGAIVDAATESERKRAQAAREEIEALEKEYDALIKKAQKNTEDEKRQETVDNLKAELAKKIQTQMDIIAEETTARQKAYDKAAEDAEKEAAQRQIELALERNARLLELAKQRTADEQAMYEELERIRAEYETKIAAAETDAEKASLKDELAREEAGRTDALVKSRAERVNALLALIEEQNNGEIDLNREQYEKLLEMMEGAGGKERDLLDELYRSRRDILLEYGEFQQEQSEAARETLTEELQTAYDAVVESSSLLSEETKKIYDSMKEEEKKQLAEYTASCEARIAAAKKVLDAETDTAHLRDVTLKTLQTATNDDLVTLLESYNPKWTTAGSGWTDALAAGMFNSAHKLEEAIGSSVSGAMNRLAELQTELDKLNKQAEGIGENYAASVDYGVSKGGYGKKGGFLLARDLVESTKNELGIHSPSRVGIEIGENYGKSIGSGIMNRIRDIRSAATAAARAMAFRSETIPELAMRAEVATKTAVTARTPDIVSALRGLKIQSIGYNQSINFNGQTSPYRAARMLRQAMEEVLE